MLPLSTESDFLQRETAFYGLFCVVTRGEAEAEYRSELTGAGNCPVERLVHMNS
jgi:hypothetical protein